MRIAINNVTHKNWLGGVQYTHNLVQALRQLPEAEQPDLLLLQSVKTNPAQNAVVASLVEIVTAYPDRPASITAWLRRWQQQLQTGRNVPTYRQVLLAHQADVIFPLTYLPQEKLPVPWIAWAWDLQHKYYPEFFSAQDISGRNATFAAMSTRAPLIVCSSQSALVDFDRFFPGAANRLRVLHFTTPLPTEWYSLDPQSLCQKYQLPEKYLAVPNTFWIHKNHRLAFEAVWSLIEIIPDIGLVCTGVPEDPRHPTYFQSLMDFINDHHLQKHIRILGVLPRVDQVQILRGSAAVLQPSLFEGWSTVVEDARALGKRILLSDIPVHREQNPPGAIYFDPRQVEALAQAIQDVWPELPAGVTPAEEARAQAAQAERVKEYARQFMRIAEEAVG